MRFCRMIRADWRAEVGGPVMLCRCTVDRKATPYSVAGYTIKFPGFLESDVHTHQSCCQVNPSSQMG